ncbi:MAG: hypothetical protein AVDCRST_MAG11-3642, partial [uncultured Gemmatimonadaceae bacterium]
EREAAREADQAERGQGRGEDLEGAPGQGLRRHAPGARGGRRDRRAHADVQGHEAARVL